MPSRNYGPRAPLFIANAKTSDFVEINLAALFELESLVLFPLIAHGEMVGALGVDKARTTIISIPKKLGS